VSQYDQSADSQLPELRGLAAAKGLEIAAEIIMEGSAWSMSNGKGAEFDARRAELLEGARLGKYATVLVWGLDCLGAEPRTCWPSPADCRRPAAS
jgi:DNA invertase Pin-like site-specific DNA recombinase